MFGHIIHLPVAAECQPAHEVGGGFAGVGAGNAQLGEAQFLPPDYTLVEVYVISSLYWYHFDFYRFNHPEEFVDAGLGEYFRSDSVCLVEWPDKAAGFVPPPDLVVALEFQPFEQSGHDGRRVTLSARSPEGEQCLNTFLTTPAANSSALPVAPPSSSS
ncbi:MAG: tRNA (adenosine(37)-N6)-threonylcarbamoyltransferase complex ATPase subunit type 1 TsaE [Betaproteobacteria bacterium]|uniref:tRNA threonylcarbamoyladenosine biosynthesis protein TsaE n=1 Tax=Candidatus Proximibacter danicus TaxID=2954365 RepID=A0A9D7K511_9PROT|nr:tRNA (adenosine(37)-N6)-threonylcarbamoyltransferase complex ATPase subunit type 1 TsaE [Candidatus Proximibacter danicus]